MIAEREINKIYKYVLKDNIPTRNLAVWQYKFTSNLILPYELNCGGEEQYGPDHEYLFHLDEYFIW